MLCANLLSLNKMKLSVKIIVSCFFLLKCVLSARQSNVAALSDEEYNVMIKKITGVFNKPSHERTNLEKSVIRKFYRWIKEGKQTTVGIGVTGTTINAE